MKQPTLFIFSLLLVMFTLPANAQPYNLAWAKSSGGNNDDAANAVAIDNAGNVYTTGYYRATSDFDPGAGTLNLTSQGDYDIFIQKLDSAGNLVWAKTIGGPDVDMGAGIAVDNAGNVYITGTFSDTVDFDPGANTYNLMASTIYDIFIEKLDADGNFVWARSMGGIGADESHAIALDRSGNIYTTGIFYDTVDFDPGIGVFKLAAKPNAASGDIYIQKLNNAGNFLWAGSIGSSAIDYGTAIATDTLGNVYFAGVFRFTADFDMRADTFNLTSVGSYDVFIEKADSNGHLLWAKSIGGAAVEEVRTMAVDGGGHVYLAGKFFATCDFDPDTSTYNLSAVGSAGFASFFVEQLDSAGNLIWAKVVGSTGSDYADARCIALDRYGSAYLTGIFSGTADFNPDADIFNLTSVGAEDIFVEKFDPNGNFVWAERMGSTHADYGMAIAIGYEGDVYTAGFYRDTIDFDPSANVFELSAKGSSNDLFVSRWWQTISGITPVTAGGNMHIYPNPTTGKIIIATDVNGDNNWQIQLASLTGQLVYRKTVRAEKIVELDIPGSAGMYLVTLRNAQGVETIGRVIKE